MLNKIQQILETCGKQDSVLPATELYSEGWMLRLVLDWFAKHRDHNDHPLSFGRSSLWFSEALIPSPFLPTFRGDLLSETWTHADGVIGNFNIGNGGKCELKLCADTKHFVVIEAKMYSKLASRVKNASNYDQAARNIACMVETLKRAECSPNLLSKLAFYVVAPAAQIEKEATFKQYTSKQSIREKVSRRVQGYLDKPDKYDVKEKANWLNQWFLPALEQISIECLSWEEIIDYIKSKDSAEGEGLSEFYHNCLKYNKFVACKW